MKRSEWLGIAQRLRAGWPHSPLPDETIAAWWEEIADLPADQVLVALRTFAREGREFCPTGGMLRARVVSLGLDAPEWGRVWRALDRICDLPESTIAAGERSHPRSEALAAQPPVVQLFVRELGWQQVRDAAFGAGSDEARLREKWTAFSRRIQRDGEVQGLPAADLRGLERANQPRALAAVIGELTEGRG